MRMLSDRKLEPLKASPGESAAQEGSAGESRPATDYIFESALVFVGELLARLCRRGHAPLVAAALWSVIPSISRGSFLKPSGDGHVHASPDKPQDDIGGESFAAADADMSARRDSHAAASSSKTPAEAKMARGSKKKAPSGSKFAFPNGTNQQRSSPSQPERCKQQEGLAEQDMVQELEAASQQQESTQQEKAEAGKEVLEGCAIIRLAMQTVKDAAALEILLAAVLREAARDLEGAGPHGGALGQAAEILAPILDGTLLARPEIRC